ncbi:MAG: hypothetical protein ACPGQT_03020 [Rhodothermales bacterium]
MNRLLLAMAFVPTGLVKLLGQRFTAMPIETPVGFFFEAMFQTGAFWHFIGFMQVAAGILLLIPATATLGAVMFVPIIFSIVLITWGIGFSGTIYITALMLLAAIYLVYWDADRIWAGMSHLLGRSKQMPLMAGATLVEKTAWILGGAVGMSFFLTTRGFLPVSSRPFLFITGLLCVLVVGASWVWLMFKGTPQDENAAPFSESAGSTTGESSAPA